MLSFSFRVLFLNVTTKPNGRENGLSNVAQFFKRDHGVSCKLRDHELWQFRFRERDEYALRGTDWNILSSFNDWYSFYHCYLCVLSRIKIKGTAFVSFSQRCRLLYGLWKLIGRDMDNSAERYLQCLLHGKSSNNSILQCQFQSVECLHVSVLVPNAGERNAPSCGKAENGIPSCLLDCSWWV